MLRIRILTLFPEMFTGILSESIIKRAQDQQLAEIQVINFRDYATDRHRTVDDYPFGGGAGMLLKPAPIFDAIDAVVASLDGQPASVTRQDDKDDKNDIASAATSGQPASTSSNEGKRREIALMSPQGQPFTQKIAEDLAALDELVLLCGHYEGFDERVRDYVSTREISIGDFVLTGGEIPAMAVMDAVIRLLPGALGNKTSAEDDSFSSGLLEHPQYTRPAEYRGFTVPDVLLSGDHARVERWRRQQSLYRTWTRRPEMLKHAELTEEDHTFIERWERGLLPED